MRVTKLILLILAVLCIGWGPMMLHQKAGSAAADYCSDGGGSDPTDQLCDDAEGANVIETGADDYDTAQFAWDSAVVDAGGTITEQNHSGVLGCAGKGAKAIQFYVVDAGGNDEDVYLQEDLLAAEQTLYSQFYFNLVSEELEDNDIVAIYTIFSGASAVTAGIYVQQIVGVLKFRLHYFKEGPTEVQVTGPTLTAGTWYRVGLKWISTTDAATGVIMYIDGAETTGITASDTENWWIDEVWLGSTDYKGLIVNDPVTFQIDIFGVDDDAALGACP